MSTVLLKLGLVYCCMSIGNKFINHGAPQFAGRGLEGPFYKIMGGSEEGGGGREEGKGRGGC